MQSKFNFTRLIPIVVVIMALVATSSCTNTKKYGCPNHLFTPTLAQ